MTHVTRRRGRAGGRVPRAPRAPARRAATSPGFFVWRVYADPDDVSQEAPWGFSPRGKLAELVVRDAFAARWACDPWAVPRLGRRAPRRPGSTRNLARRRSAPSTIARPPMSACSRAPRSRSSRSAQGRGSAWAGPTRSAALARAAPRGDVPSVVPGPRTRLAPEHRPRPAARARTADRRRLRRSRTRPPRSRGSTPTTAPSAPGSSPRAPRTRRTTAAASSPSPSTTAPSPRRRRRCCASSTSTASARRSSSSAGTSRATTRTPSRRACGRGASPTRGTSSATTRSTTGSSRRSRTRRRSLRSTTSAAAIERATGKRPVLFRPPYGELDPWLEGALRDRKQELVLWSIDVEDMKKTDPDEIVERAEDAARVQAGRHRPSPRHALAVGEGVQPPAPVAREPTAGTRRTPTSAGWDIVDLPEYLQGDRGRPAAVRDARGAGARARRGTRRTARGSAARSRVYLHDDWCRHECRRLLHDDAGVGVAASPESGRSPHLSGYADAARTASSSTRDHHLPQRGPCDPRLLVEPLDRGGLDEPNPAAQREPHAAGPARLPGAPRRGARRTPRASRRRCARPRRPRRRRCAGGPGRACRASGRSRCTRRAPRAGARASPSPRGSPSARGAAPPPRARWRRRSPAWSGSNGRGGPSRCRRPAPARRSRRRRTCAR